MNAAQLYAGEYYAYHSSPPKGRIPIDAKKVRLRYMEQRKGSFDANRKTYAAITVVDTGKEMLVRARELIMFWDEYQIEQEHMLAEQREREKAFRRRNLRRTVLSTTLNYRLTERGIPVIIEVNYDERTAHVPVRSLLDWLGIEEEEIQAAIDRVMVEEYGEET